MTDVSGGFLRPTTTPTPDELFDVWLSKLSGSELKVLLYIVRRTFGFGKEADAISLTQICEGITTRDGRVLDLGTGLARSTASAAVKQLEDHGLIAVERVQDEERGFVSNFYRLRFRDAGAGPPHDDDVKPGPAEDADADDTNNGSDLALEMGSSEGDNNPVGAGSEIEPGVVRKANQGSSKSQPALVRKSNPQQTALQETASQQTGRQQTEGQPPAPPPEQRPPESAAPARETSPPAGGAGQTDSETVPDRQPVQLSLIHPPPTTHPIQHAPVREEREQAVSALVDFGVWRAKAEQLVDKLGLSPEAVECACAALEAERQRGADITNPGAVLAARLASGWQPPPPDPPPDSYARWGLDEEEVMGVRVGQNLADHRPPLPPIVTASGTEHAAHGWFAALKGELELQMAREIYDTWLRPAELVGHTPAIADTPTTLTIRLHNLYAKAWIEHRLDKVILRQAVRMLGKAVRLVYVGPEEAEQPPGDRPWWALTKTTLTDTETERNAS